MQRKTSKTTVRCSSEVPARTAAAKYNRNIRKSRPVHASSGRCERTSMVEFHACARACVFATGRIGKKSRKPHSKTLRGPREKKNANHWQCVCGFGVCSHERLASKICKYATAHKIAKARNIARSASGISAFLCASARPGLQQPRVPRSKRYIHAQ